MFQQVKLALGNWQLGVEQFIAVDLHHWRENAVIDGPLLHQIKKYMPFLDRKHFNQQF
jgi:hypothetical protein